MNATTLHANAIVVDAHCDTLGDVLEGLRKLGERSALGQVDLPRLKEGGLTAQIFACFVPIDQYRHGATKHALQRMDMFFQALEAHPHALMLATSAADIRKAKRAGKIAGILGLEGAEPIEDSIELLRSFYRLGVRNLGLTWNFRNDVADGVFEGDSARGLTRFGVKVVEECNRRGRLIDVSHLAPAGLEDVLRVSQHPIIASHSNAAAVCNNVRNLTDEQIEAIAGRGGLIGVTFVPSFLAQPYRAASLDHVLDHVDYLVKTAGADHVMLGSDFDGMGAVVPKGMEDATCFPALTAGMLSRGHSEQTVRRILGLNFLRVFETVVGR
jgi:membrane dipeptidase